MGGKMEWPDGSTYEGGYTKDLKHGEGTLTWPDGRVYTGQWVNGNQEGTGVYVDRIGVELKGIWRGGVQISGEQVGGPQISFPQGFHKRAAKGGGQIPVAPDPPLKSQQGKIDDDYYIEVTGVNPKLDESVQEEKPSLCRCN